MEVQNSILDFVKYKQLQQFGYMKRVPQKNNEQKMREWISVGREKGEDPDKHG